MQADRSCFARGFTLLELLIAISIFVVIASMVYATFSGVTRTVDGSRTATEELRLRQFLGQSLRTNIATAYVDPSYEQEAFQFLGVNGEGVDGSKDSLRFISTAPLIGGLTLPGDLKEVRYEVDDPDSSMGLTWDDADEQDVTAGALTGLAADLRDQYARLRVTETPLIAANVQSLDDKTGYFTPIEGYESPHWEAPMRTFDVTYFDGEQWVDEWDSVEMGRLPWALHVRANFARSEEYLEQERGKSYDELDDPEFEMVLTLPVGQGVYEDQRGAQPGMDGRSNPDGAPTDEDGSGGDEDGSEDTRTPGGTSAPQFAGVSYDVPEGATE